MVLAAVPILLLAALGRSDKARLVHPLLILLLPPLRLLQCLELMLARLPPQLQPWRDFARTLLPLLLLLLLTLLPGRRKPPLPLSPGLYPLEERQPKLRQTLWVPLTPPPVLLKRYLSRQLQAAVLPRPRWHRYKERSFRKRTPLTTHNQPRQYQQAQQRVLLQRLELVCNNHRGHLRCHAIAVAVLLL